MQVHARGSGTRWGSRSGALLVVALWSIGLVAATSGPAFAAPANDNFSSARATSRSSGSVSRSLAGATLEAGEQVHSFAEYEPEPTASIWYTYRAPAAGRLHVRSDAVVDIYTGSTVRSLTEAAEACDT